MGGDHASGGSHLDSCSFCLHSYSISSVEEFFKQARWDDGLRLLSGLVLPFLLFLWYNHLRFGDPLDFGSARLIERVGEQSLFNHDPCWPVWRAALANLLSPGLGLLFHAPALFVLPLAFFSARRRFSVYATFAVGMTVIYLVGYGSYGTWDGGAFGPRFMLPVIGLLFPLLGPMIEGAFKKGQGRTVGLLTTGVILLQLLVLPIYPPFALERLQDEDYNQKMTYFSLTHNQIVTHLVCFRNFPSLHSVLPTRM